MRVETVTKSDETDWFRKAKFRFPKSVARATMLTRKGKPEDPPKRHGGPGTRRKDPQDFDAAKPKGAQ